MRYLAMFKCIRFTQSRRRPPRISQPGSLKWVKGPHYGVKGPSMAVKSLGVKEESYEKGLVKGPIKKIARLSVTTKKGRQKMRENSYPLEEPHLGLRRHCSLLIYCGTDSDVMSNKVQTAAVHGVWLEHVNDRTRSYSRCRTLISVCNQPATHGQLSLPSLRGR